MSHQDVSLAARLRAALSSSSAARTSMLVATGIAALALLATLRQAAPPQDGPAPPRATGLPVRFTPSPSMSPRGDLPQPAVVDKAGNRIIGHIPLSGAKPGNEAVLLEVGKILDWYCPQAAAPSVSVRQVNGWQSVQATARPHPGAEIVLSLMWTGTWYRWQGRYDQLDSCW